MEYYLGYDVEELNALGASMTAKEITQQPEVWNKILKYIDGQGETITKFIKPILESNPSRIIFTGAGTSAFVGHSLVPFIKEITGKRVESIATTDIVSNPSQYLREDIPTLLISFARSGNSPESVAAVEIAEYYLTNCRHLLITCNKEGMLYKNNLHRRDTLALVMPIETNDNGFAMTSSFTSMMLSALAVFLLKDGQVLARFKHIAENTKSLIPSYVRYIQEIIDDKVDRIIYLGSGGLQGLAQEAALKILELTAGKIVATYDSPLGFRHGPKSIVNENTVVVEFLSNDVYTRQYDVDLYNELRRDNISQRIIALSAKSFSDTIKDVICINQFSISKDYELLFPYIIFAQIYAFYSSIKCRITTDNPCPTGEVNRVVQGVIIHPLKK